MRLSSAILLVAAAIVIQATALRNSQGHLQEHHLIDAELRDELQRHFQSAKVDLRANLAVTPDQIRQLVKSTMQFWNVTGAAVAVIADGNPMFCEGFGFAVYSTQTPVDNRTLFQIASNSKAFTSMVAATLVQDGALDLDLPIRNFVPSFRLKNAYASETLTMRDLMTHRSGLPRHDGMWAGMGLTRQEIFRRLQFLDLDKEPRYADEYNNLMYMAAGVVEEQVSGQSWADLVQQRILDKLGMRRTYPEFRLVPEAEKPTLAECYGFSNVESGHSVSVRLIGDETGPAGSIVSNIEDLLKWAQAHLAQLRSVFKAPTGGAQPLVQDRFYNQIVTPTSLFPNLNNMFGTYAQGWFVEPLGTTAVMHHGGNLAGMSSYVGFAPLLGNGLGYAILTNQQSSYVPVIVFLSLIDIFSGRQPPDYNNIFLASFKRNLDRQAAAAADFERRKNDPNPKAQTPLFPLTAYVSAYNHPAYGTINVTLNNAGTALKAAIMNMRLPTEQQTFEVDHLWYETFGIKLTGVLGDGYLPMTFVNDGDGTVVAAYATLEPNVAPIMFGTAGYRSGAYAYQQAPTCNLQTPDKATNNDQSVTADLNRGSLWSVILLTAFFSTLFMAIIFAFVSRCVRNNNKQGGGTGASESLLRDV